MVHRCASGRSPSIVLRRKPSVRRRGLGLVFAATTALAVAPLAAPAFSAPAADWQRQEPVPTSYTFRDVDMVSATQGWTVASPVTGDDGIVLTTTDGGVSWSRQGGTFRQLLTVSFSDALHGISLGNEARYTTDGGATWKQGGGAAGTIYDAEMANATTAFATAATW